MCSSHSHPFVPRELLQLEHQEEGDLRNLDDGTMGATIMSHQVYQLSSVVEMTAVI